MFDYFDKVMNPIICVFVSSVVVALLLALCGVNTPLLIVALIVVSGALAAIGGAVATMVSFIGLIACIYWYMVEGFKKIKGGA